MSNVCNDVCARSERAKRARSLLVFLIHVYKIFFSATKVYIDDVLTGRAWKRDSVAKKK